MGRGLVAEAKLNSTAAVTAVADQNLAIAKARGRVAALAATKLGSVVVVTGIVHSSFPHAPQAEQPRRRS